MTATPAIERSLELRIARSFTPAAGAVRAQRRLDPILAAVRSADEANATSALDPVPRCLRA
jgi:hypothetical protein